MPRLLNTTIAACCVAFSLQVLASEIQPFESDGCSSFPDGTLAQNTLWLNCCQIHDFAYWRGGTYQERQDADQANVLLMWENQKSRH